MSKYTFLPLSIISSHMPEIRERKVSVRARAPSQFLDQYRSVNGSGKALPEQWIMKRNAFIDRTLAAYIKNPTLRRWLSMIVWAYRAHPVPSK